MFAALGLGTLLKSMNSQPMLNLSVYDYLWGYEDPLVRLASNIVPNIINFETFGILDRVCENFIIFLYDIVIKILFFSFI